MFELKSLDSKVCYQFDQAQILVGMGGDLVLPEEELGSEHLAIAWKDGHYVIENKAHDYKCLINGKPFWKKQLQDNDKVQIGHSEFIFQKLSDCLFLKEEKGKEKLAQKIRTLDEILHASHPAPKNPMPPPKVNSSYWHLFILALSCVLLFAVLFSTTFYITIRERAEVERIFAARGLADIALILMAAKEQGKEPPFKNWLDPTFLKEIGQQILPKDSLYEWIDSEGQFLEASYILRLYSDADFERFLLIAQPKANKLQSILQKSTLVVDSKNMIIKEFWKVRDLNRLLISSSGFEGIIKTEIAELIQKAESMPLEALEKGKEKWGFKTPDELAMLDPEALYPIYNAPRYYLLSEPIVDQADKAARNPHNQAFKEQLDQMVKNLTRRHQILYSTKGIESVIGARKVFAKKGDLLLGYLQLSPEGKIEESHLLMPNQRSWSIGAYHHQALISDDTPKEAKSSLHPFHEILPELLKKRESFLQPPAVTLIDLIQSHLQNPDLLFFTHFHNHLEHFKEKSQDAQIELDQSLKELFEKYVLDEKTLDLNQFLSILDEHRIDLGLNEDPEIFERFYDESIAFEVHLNHLFEMIERAEDLDSLDSLVLVANDLLNQKEGPDSRLSWKKHLKMLCIRKLETLLWQPELEPTEEGDSFDIQWKIARILKNGYINDAEGRTFYLSHFLEEVE